MRYAMVRNDKIYAISSSNNPSNQDNTHYILIPEELASITNTDLILYGRVKDNQIHYKNIKKPASQMKVALVGNWRQKCGISTYHEFLWPEVVKHLGDFKLFIEYNELPTGSLNQVGDQIVDSDKIISCWKRGESLKTLIAEIKKYDPDIVWIGHEYGLWPNAAYWLSMMNQLSEYRVIVTMHSVFHHRDKTIIEAAIPEIVVHLQGAQDVLKQEKCIPGKVYVIPHGCDPCVNKERLWNFYKSNHTILQFGFGLRYKGWENSIKATALLKDKFPNVFFTGLFSESPHNLAEHQIYYNELMDLVEQLGVEENVAIIRRFQSEQTLDSYLRTNQVAIFPYISNIQHEVFGASGAARFAMAKAIPVITSSVNHFSDLNTIKANSPEEMAQALEKCFTDSQFKEEQVSKQIEYLNEHSWEKTGLKYISLFENV